MEQNTGISKNRIIINSLGNALPLLFFVSRHFFGGVMVCVIASSRKDRDFKPVQVKSMTIKSRYLLLLY